MRTIPQRYSTNRKGQKVDNFFQAWMMANVTANNPQTIHRLESAQKEYLQYAGQLCLSDYQITAAENKKLFEQEWTRFAKEYINSCLNNKNYTTMLFGFITISKEEIKNKILTECSRVTKDFPTALGMEELYKPLYLIMMEEINKIFN